MNNTNKKIDFYDLFSSYEISDEVYDFIEEQYINDLDVAICKDVIERAIIFEVSSDLERVKKILTSILIR